jgi:hypothetical protein
VQIRAYQEQVLKIIEDLTDELSQFGWNFKNERQFELKQRLTPYRMSIIISDSALYHLREMESVDRREQIEYLRERSARDGWEIRIMNRACILGGPLSVFLAAELDRLA